MNDAGDPSGKIKVVDRRRFDDAGELRSDWKPENASVSDAGAKASPPQARHADPPPTAEPKTRTDPPPAPEPKPRADTPPRDPAAPATSPLFLDLVHDLAQQAALLLSGAEGLPAQPEHSKRLIDYLGAIETKTRGNLSAEESKLLSSVIFQLRTAFVQRSP